MGATADPDEGTVGQDNLKAENVRTCDPVLQASGSSRIGRDVSPKGAVLVALRIGRIEEASFLHLDLERSGDHVRFHHGDKVFTADFANAVHPVETHQDAAPQRNASPDIAHPGPASGDGDVLPVCVGKHRRYLLGRSRRDGNFGQGGCEPLVGAQLGETRRVGDDPRLGGYQPAKVPLQVGAGGILFARGTGLGSLCAHIPMIS